jgi:DUF177 domain-containing protein
MPAGWTIPRDVAKLATARAEFNLEVPFAELPGMPAEWAGASGTVHATLRFAREQGLAVVDVAIQGSVPMICQRCLEPMMQLLESSSRVAVVSTSAQADGVPAEWETVLASDGQLTLAALIAEEVLLSLPVVPRHTVTRDCGTLARELLEPLAATAPAAQEAETQRPFADLRALLGKEPR